MKWKLIMAIILSVVYLGVSLKMPFILLEKSIAHSTKNDAGLFKDNVELRTIPYEVDQQKFYQLSCFTINPDVFPQPKNETCDKDNYTT